MITRPLSAVEHRIADGTVRIPLILLLIVLFYLVICFGPVPPVIPIRGSTGTGPTCYDRFDCNQKNLELKVFNKLGIHIDGYTLSYYWKYGRPPQ